MNKNGGPAFPIQGGWGLDSTGMTLRDYFAIRIFHCLYDHIKENLASDGEDIDDMYDEWVNKSDIPEGESNGQPSFWAVNIAKQAYGAADAMLAVRQLKCLTDNPKWNNKGGES